MAKKVKEEAPESSEVVEAAEPIEVDGDDEVEEEEEIEDSVPKKKKMEILDRVSFEQDPSNLTLILYEEDHTIGNSVKHLLTRMDDVEFCGYNVPHPLEDKILLRVQTRNGVNALQVLMKALEDLETVFKTIEDKFEQAHTAFA